ncbi:hypothetical protein [Fibrivirga algicola]|uniref:DUF4760 domain-containing protein n=1 Tax=Fibrivirga algicola TaxID=2950420 RepID=A0ABX0QM41_9BACT|nr:hypothetical protein [Fibrivirga algicola]NID13524.1 hypothetical protein [Fibrivirga algicola]
MTFSDFATVASNLATVGAFFLALFYARKINENVEKRKNDILKEKEWQVIWADNFLKKAIEFNDTLSSSLVKFAIAHKLDDQKESLDLVSKSRHDLYKLSELEWNLKNYTLFTSDFQKNKQLNEIQLVLMNFITSLHTTKG